MSIPFSFEAFKITRQKFSTGQFAKNRQILEFLSIELPEPEEGGYTLIAYWELTERTDETDSGIRVLRYGKARFKEGDTGTEDLADEIFKNAWSFYDDGEYEPWRARFKEVK